jgi:hypothetical protein
LEPRANITSEEQILWIVMVAAFTVWFNGFDWRTGTRNGLNLVLRRQPNIRSHMPWKLMNFCQLSSAM